MSEYEGEELDDKNGDGRRGHAKTSSYSERDRKIGHRRINEETGEVSYKKITTNQLMSSIQLGIHTSAGGLAKYPERDILMHDFKTVETTHFPKQGSQQTPAHPYADFTFRQVVQTNLHQLDRKLDKKSSYTKKIDGKWKENNYLPSDLLIYTVAVHNGKMH